MSSIITPIVDSCMVIFSSFDVRKIAKLAEAGEPPEQIAEAVNKSLPMVEALVQDMQQSPSFGLGLSEKNAKRFDLMCAKHASASKLARTFDLPKDRVIKALKAQGLYVSKKVPPISDEEIQQVLTGHANGQSVKDLALLISRDLTTVRKIIREYSAPKNSSLTDKEKKEVEQFYLEYKLTPTQIAKLLSTKTFFRSPEPIRAHLRSVGLFYGKKTSLELTDKKNIRRYVFERNKGALATACGLKLNYNLVADYMNTFNEVKFGSDLTKEVRIAIRHLFKDKKDYVYIANELLLKPSVVLAFLKERGLIKEPTLEVSETDEKKIIGLLNARRKKIIEDVALATGVHPEVVQRIANKV